MLRLHDDLHNIDTHASWRCCQQALPPCPTHLMCANHPTPHPPNHPGDDTPVPAPPDAPIPSRFAPLNLPLVLIIRLYRLTLSPFIGMHCRHIPTCSQYALEACHWHAPPRAVWLITTRLLACRPGGRAGYDPIPLPDPPKSKRAHASTE